MLAMGCCISFSAAGSPLGDLAASMQPGEWRELQTSGLSAAIDDDGSSQHILTFSQGGRTWNPATREAYFIGGDHNGGNEHWIRYVDATNTWESLPDPAWFPGGTTQNHSYDHNTIDPVKQYYFYQTRRYNIQTGVWDFLTTSGLSSASRGHHAWEYFDGLGLVRIADGNVHLLRDNAGSWTTLETGLTWSGLHPVSEYSPTLRAMIFGGGDGSDSLYKLEDDESITALAATPVSQLSMDSFGGLLTHDPVSGEFLYADRNHTFWAYDLNGWTQLPSLNFITNADVDDCIFIPVSTYGVVLLIEHISVGNSKMWVYKHAPSGPRPNSPTGLTVQ
jgi:hypothetical protein